MDNAQHTVTCRVSHASFPQLFLQVKPLCVHMQREHKKFLLVISLTLPSGSQQSPSIFLEKVGWSESTLTYLPWAGAFPKPGKHSHDSQRMRKHQQPSSPERPYSGPALTSDLLPQHPHSSYYHLPATKTAPEAESDEVPHWMLNEAWHLSSLRAAVLPTGQFKSKAWGHACNMSASARGLGSGQPDWLDLCSLNP